MLRRITSFFNTTFIGGFLVILPVAVLFGFGKMIYDFLAKVLLEPIGRNLIIFDNSFLSNLLALIIIITFCFFVGLVARTQFGKRLYRYIDRVWLTRIPFYETIKDTIEQFTNSNKSTFSQVVLVDVFGNDTRMTGFVSDEHDSGHYTIFVPTGPNPTNGFIFHVKKEQLTFLDIEPQDAMRTIIGVGTGSSDLMKFD